MNANDNLGQILALLKSETGYDFSRYKIESVTHKIQERMALNDFSEMETYHSYLQETPLELDLLLQKFLLSNSRFFWDPEAYSSLEQNVIKPLFNSLRDNPRKVRIWIPGCSTGEDAYSIAILMGEWKKRIDKPVDIQIFATDVDQNAIKMARIGRYPQHIASDVGELRLQEFFIIEKETNTYQLQKPIREMIVFAVQDIVKDPPFSKLDLVCCQNLFPYLKEDQQKQVLPLLHYSLNASGSLFLGISETIDISKELFKPIDPNFGIFQKVETVSKKGHEFELPTRLHSEAKAVDKLPRLKTQSLTQQLTEKLILKERTPTSILINKEGDILSVVGQTGKYLKKNTGEANMNIFQLVREELLIPLSSAVRIVASQEKPQIVRDGIKLNVEGQIVSIRIIVSFVHQYVDVPDIVLISFIEVPSDEENLKSDNTIREDDSQTRIILELEQELISTRAYLHTVVEELKTTNQELAMVNEELVVANEELQIINEEFSASQTELKLINQDLSTLNTELENRVDQLIIANNDIKNLLENTQLGIVFLDKNLCIRRYTHSTTSVLNLIPTDIGRSLSHFTHELDYDGLVKDAQETVSTLMPKEIEVRSRNQRWYIIRFLPYYTIAQQADGILITFTDITRLKEVETALRESQKILQDIVDNTPALIYILDTEGRFLLVNRKIEEVLGIPNKMIIGQKRNSLLNEDIADQHRQNDLKVITSLQPHTFEEENIQADGQHYYLTTKFPLLDNRNEIYAIGGISVDISDRRGMEEALRRSERRAQALLNVVPDQIFRLNREGVFLDYKSDQSDLFAQSTNLLGKKNRDLTPPDFADLIDQKIEETLESEEMQLFEYQLNIPERGIREYEARMFASDADEVTAIVRDVTEQKKAEAERHEHQMQMLEDQRLKSLGLLAGGVAHDINNLLTPITLNLEKLRTEYINTTEGQDVAQSVERASQKISNIVQQMLIYAGRAKSAFRSIEFNEIVSDIALLLNSSLPKNTELILDLTPTPLIIYGDRTQLEQVLMNLILNASEAFANKRGKISVTTRHEDSDARHQRHEMILEIRDNGPGISPENLAKIFDPFFSTKATGRGLGLSATQGIIYGHQGEIEVESTPGEGTTFKIRLPLEGANGEKASTPKANQTVSTENALGELWLIIDDEKWVREVTADVLQMLGVNKLEASNGELGLELIEKHSAELSGVILDLTMQGMSGREVFEKLRQLNPEIPVVFVSGFSEQDVEDLLSQSKVRFLSKPFNSKAIRKVMESLINE